MGTFTFSEVWGRINPAKMQDFISSKIPPEEQWTESAADVYVIKSNLGIRLDPVVGGTLVTEGPNSFIPRMMAAVCSVPRLMIEKSPVIALLSYDAIELADGQVPSPKSKVEFYITLLRFSSERKATAFSVGVIQLWNELREARKKRMAAGLQDADIGGDPDTLTPAQRSMRRSSVVSLSIKMDDEVPGGGSKIEEEEIPVEMDDEAGYLEVQVFGMG